jgi:hypothetical protein
MADVLTRALGMIRDQCDPLAWGVASDYLEDVGHEDAGLLRAVAVALGENPQNWRFLSPFPDEENALDLAKVFSLAFKAFLWSRAGQPCETHIRQFTRRRRPGVFYRVYPDGSLWHCSGREDFLWKSADEFVNNLVSGGVTPRGTESRELIAWYFGRQAG